MSDKRPLLIIENVVKSYGAVKALKGILFTLNRGKIVTLIADRIIVLRQGRHVATLHKQETTPQEIAAYITGAKDPMVNL